MNYLSNYFTSKAITTYVILVIACFVLFLGRGLPFIWIIFGLVEVITFLYFSNLLTRKWAAVSSPLFQKKLFKTALVIRIAYVIFIYFFYQLMTGQPFEFEAADSQGYHNTAIWIVGMFESGTLDYYFNHYLKGVSDSGFEMWLAAIYFFSDKSILVARLVNAVIGAWTCVLIYKLARRNFGEEAGRISSILAMLLPTLIYYCGLHVKETLMIFILMAFTEKADYLVRMQTLKTWNLLIVVLLGTALFFFRTVLAIVAWFSIFSTLLFSAKSMIGFARKVIYITWFSIVALIVISGTILAEVQEYKNARTSNQAAQMNSYSTRKGANNLAKYGSASVFLPMILITPFPTLVNIEDQKNSMLINGNVFVHNIYAFFIFIALFVLYKKKLITQHIMILVLLLSYLVIVAMSGFALAERFQMPAVPFLLILAGYGITEMNNKNVKYYVPYLVFIGLVILGWNWFKLVGRGAI